MNDKDFDDLVEGITSWVLACRDDYQERLRMDKDLDKMSVPQLQAEVKKLRAAIRVHRDASGHNLCWYVPELWNTLPEKVETKIEVPGTCEFLENCKVYRKSLDK